MTNVITPTHRFEDSFPLSSPVLSSPSNVSSLMSLEEANQKCRWDLYLIGDCPDIFFHLVFYFTIVLSFAITLFAGGLLIYKRLRDKSPLWTDHMFEPMTGFLLWLTAAEIGSGVLALGAVCDWNRENVILTSFMVGLCWFCRSNAIATYLVGIFKAIPRLTFHQNTSSCQIKKEHERFIPSNRSIVIIYWTWVASYSILSTVLSVISGYLLEGRKFVVYEILLTVLLVLYGIASLFGVICFVNYGTLVVSLTKKSVQLTGGKDLDSKKVNGIDTFQHQRYKTYLRKLKIVNFALSAIVLWSSIMYFVFSFGRKSLSSNVKFSAVTCLINEIGSSAMFFIALCGIFHGEISHKINTEVNNPKTSSQWSEFSQNEIQDA